MSSIPEPAGERFDPHTKNVETSFFLSFVFCQRDSTHRRQGWERKEKTFWREERRVTLRDTLTFLPGSSQCLVCRSRNDSQREEGGETSQGNYGVSVEEGGGRTDGCSSRRGFRRLQSHSRAPSHSSLLVILCL